jgi:hypothetical protein
MKIWARHIRAPRSFGEYGPSEDLLYRCTELGEAIELDIRVSEDTTRLIRVDMNENGVIDQGVDYSG